MKLYVIPVETLCNASCSFCITKFREMAEKEFLDINDLENVLKKEFEKIEITGGGEPFLHKEINEIMNICKKKAKTQIYTNASLINETFNLQGLEFLCISRMHYDNKENEKIMGINYNFDKVLEIAKPQTKIKLSLLLCKSGIHDEKEILEYFKWAESREIDKVVVRQMFEHNYPEDIEKEYVSTQELFEKLKINNYNIVNGNPILFIDNLKIEFEYRSCSCETQNPVLHANGKLTRWE